MKALALHSGGLDSTLAIRVIQDQGIEVDALHFVSVFDTGLTDELASANALRSAEHLGAKPILENISDELLSIVKNPKHGHGSNLNPCIDCHAMMFRRAGAKLRECAASFLITGEVLGERPMSQRREALGIVERESGMEGLLLRPLCARLLEPTTPELKGWVDREKLLRISGRSRKPQMELAKKYGIVKYPHPAGGCLLTDPGFSERLGDLLKHQPDCTPDDVRLLKLGRHFRLNPRAKVVVGRDQAENDWLEKFARPGETFVEAADVSGPLSLVTGPVSEADLLLAAAITLRHGKAARQASARVRLAACAAAPAWRFLEAAPAAPDLIERLRVGSSSEAPRRGE